MRTGLNSSLPSLRSIRGSPEKRRALLLSAALPESIRTSLPLLPLRVQSCSITAQLYNAERGNVGCVSALLELQPVCGYSHPEGWYVSLWHFEWRFDFGRGRRWNLQSAVPAQTLILLRFPLHPAICKYSFTHAHVHACYWPWTCEIILLCWHFAGDVCSCCMSCTAERGLCFMMSNGASY